MQIGPFQFFTVSHLTNEFLFIYQIFHGKAGILMMPRGVDAAKKPQSNETKPYGFEQQIFQSKLSSGSTHNV